MKILRALSLLAACLFAASVTSCVSDGLTEPGNEVVGKEIATLEEQASSVMTTISDVKALKETVDGHEVELNGAIRSLESHVSYLSSGSSWEDATLATLAEQKKLAAVVGPILAQTDAASATKTTLNSLDANAKAWLGKNMGAYWSAVSASAKSEAQLASYSKKLSMWKLQIEGIASDIEAGLKEGVDLAETDALLASVSAVVKASEDLNARLSALASDVEEGYQQAIATASEDPESFDAATLRSLNKAAAADLQDAGVTMNDLIDLVAACENEVTAMQERVGELEEKVEDLEQLLDLIQSVTFMSEFSEDRIIAYYNLNTESDERTPEGYMLRTRDESITLKYIVRPAAAAAALASDEAKTSLWNNGLNVMGYYAEAITKAAPAMEEFEITNVTADASGIMTVTVANTLSDDFYFKKTGAKMALSIQSGKTDLASKFIEIVPKDASNTVYAESLTITESVDIEMNQSMSLKAVVTPAGASQTVIWNTNAESVAKISDAGLLTGWSAGTAKITATAVATDEWGRQLIATCDVKVNPDIKIVGPKYVEKGSYINLRLESPRAIDQSKVAWTTSHASNVSIEKSFSDGFNRARVNGDAVLYEGGKYKDITLTCTIEGEPTLTHTVQCVEVQPRKIVVGGLGDDENEITLKFGQSRTFNSVSVDPAGVDAGKFTLAYATSGPISKSADNLTVTAQDESHLKNGKTTGTYTVSLNSAYYWYDLALQQSADKLTRNIAVNVEPYYITGLSIPASQNMTVDQVLNQLPDITFTSDDPSHEPSYTDLTWASSAPEYVSVNETTGELNAHQVTTEPVRITASIKNPEISVKPGDTVADAYCYVTVTEAAADDPKIGDYYFADGTFATDLPDGYNHATSNNKVIGIIFYLGNVTEYDTRLVTDGYGNCVHGLVVSIDEYISYPGSFENYGSAPSVMTYPFDIEHTRGYTNTVQLSEYGRNKGSGYAKMYRYDSEGVPGIHSSTVTSPASPWYVPSFAEMRLINAKLSVVNNSLNNAELTQIETKDYWISTFRQYSNRNEINDYRTYSLSADGWGGTAHSTTASCSKEFPVRLILAF